MQCLAQELVDRIIDLVADAPPRRPPPQRALASCTLVARAWLPRASTHLFARLAVRPERADAFAAALASSRRLVENVAELSLTAGPAAGTAAVAALLALRPPRLRRIEYQDHLLLSAARADDARPCTRELGPARHKLAHLTLRALDACALSELLASFDDIGSLALDPQHRYPFYRARAESPWPLPCHLRVHTLVLADVAAASALGYVRVLRTHLRPRALTRVVFEGFAADRDAPAVDAALRALGGAAEELALAFYDKDIALGPEQAASRHYALAALSACHALHTLTLTFTDVRQQLPWALATTLPHVPPALTHLALVLPSPADLRRLAHAPCLAHLDAALARCARIAALEVRVAGAAMWAPSERALFDEMREALPRGLSGRVAALTRVVLV
ncbi:hypothetical protein PsYK624_112640 [Phanerochaete sordida]|uniref:Uncharacterized protein n=1 Tax=Phanerochaete sordida TaxID=48140 RepID=A0A9P3GIX1_9APHY|nr:hypothetical protein PsYK624_112640 [Phanerochaete sordida]